MNTITKADYCSIVLKKDQDMKRYFLELARHLYEIQKEEYYKPKWQSFSEYCAEFYMAQATVSKLLNIHKKMVLEYNIEDDTLAELGYSKLAEIIPYCTNVSNAKKWMSRAMTYSRAELREALAHTRNR